MGVVSGSGRTGQKAELDFDSLQQRVKGTNFGLPTGYL